MGKFNYIVSILLVLSITSYGKINESKSYNLLEEAKSQILINTEYAAILLDSCKLYLDETREKNITAEYYFISAQIHLEQNNLEQAEFLLQKSIIDFQKLNEIKKTAQAYFVLSKVNIYSSNYNKAIENSLKAKSIYDSLNLQKKSIECTNIIGSVFFHLNQFYLAKEYYKEVEAFAVKHKDENLLLISLINLANIYASDTIKDYTKAISYYTQAIKLSKKTNSASLQTAHLNLGIILFEINLIDSAKKHLTKALAFKQTENTYYSSQLHLLLGIIAEKEGNITTSKKHFNKSIELSKKGTDFKSLKENYLHIAEIQYKFRDYKNAYDNLLLSAICNDSIINEEQIKRINDINLKYTKDIKNNKFEIQEAKIESQKYKIIKHRYGFAGLLLALFAILIITTIRLYYSKKLSINNEYLKKTIVSLNEKNTLLEKTVSTRDKLLSTIAHDIKNPLGTISGFAELILMYNNDENRDKINMYAKQIHNSSKSLFLLLENLVEWAKSQKHNIKTTPEELSISELVGSNYRLLREMAMAKNINLINQCNTEHRIYADKNTINTVLRNLLNNAIKFTELDGKIRIYSEIQNNNLLIHIHDSGVGINAHDIPLLFNQNIDINTIGNHKNKGTGLGLVLSHEFIKLNNGNITVSSKVNQGTCFTLSLPKAQAS